jgi:hypothetical protein
MCALSNCNNPNVHFQNNTQIFLHLKKVHPDPSQTDLVTVASFLSNYKMGFGPACRSFYFQNPDKAFHLHSCVPGSITVSNVTVATSASLVCPTLDAITASAPAAPAKALVDVPEVPSSVEPTPAP